MEIFIIYLYGIYDNVDSLLEAALILLTLSTIFGGIAKGIVATAMTDEVPESDTHKGLRRWFDHWSSLILIKPLIIVAIIAVLLPPKNIMLAMFATPYALDLASTIADSNATKRVGDIIDLALDKAESKLK